MMELNAKYKNQSKHNRNRQNGTKSLEQIPPRTQPENSENTSNSEDDHNGVLIIDTEKEQNR